LRVVGTTGRAVRIERLTTLLETRRQIRTVGPLQSLLTLVRTLSPVGEVDEEQHVGHQLLGTRGERAPPGRRRDPQVVLPRAGPSAVPGSDLRRDAEHVDPDEAFRLPGLEREDGELRGLPDERVPPVGAAAALNVRAPVAPGTS
jgi:hypothetical protein